MYKSKVWVPIMIVIIGIGTYLALHRSGKDREAAQHRVIIAQAAKTLLYLPLYIAQDEGYFHDEGIDVSIVTSGGDSQAFAALASAQAQFAQGDPTFVAISHERGGPGIVIASVLDRVAFWGVTFDQKLAPFSDSKGFRGLTVVTYPEPNTAYVVQKNLVKKAGLNLGKDTYIAQATFGAELGPIQVGKAQIAVSIEPTVSQAIAQNGHIVFSYANAWGPFLLTGLMSTEEFESKNPKLIQGMVNAYERALRLLHDKPEVAAAIGKKNFPEVDTSVIESAVKRLISENVFPEHAQVNLGSWRSALQLRAQVGDLQNTSHDDLVHNAYGTAALQITK